ncbi:hypothetical protein, partial [Okeania sp. SIO2C9]|uniref:hypothetical protein n=1 Tax=Okeania sp. SIO2C9 TaxID=2607791 RepID=UPI0025D3FB2B
VRDYLNGINHPPSLFPWFFEAEETKKYLAQKNTKCSGLQTRETGLANRDIFGSDYLQIRTPLDSD